MVEKHGPDSSIHPLYNSSIWLAATFDRFERKQVNELPITYYSSRSKLGLCTLCTSSFSSSISNEHLD